MRTNYSGFALAVGMGLMVLLIGLLALSMGGLVQLGPALEEEVTVEEFSQCQGQGPVLPTGVRPLPASNTAAGRAIPVGQAIQAGDALFKSNCVQCHAVNERVVGPALAGITRRRTISWLIPWVHNSAKVIASGDEYAVRLFNDNGKQQMPAFPQLSDGDIRNITAWISWQQGDSLAAGVTTVAVAK